MSAVLFPTDSHVMDKNHNPIYNSALYMLKNKCGFLHECSSYIPVSHWLIPALHARYLVVHTCITGIVAISQTLRWTHRLLSQTSVTELTQLFCYLDRGEYFLTDCFGFCEN